MADMSAQRPQAKADQSLTVGSVVLTLVGDEIRITTTRADGLSVSVPSVALERWALKFLRELLVVDREQVR